MKNRKALLVNLFLKRLADIVGSGIGIVIAFPILLLSILVLKATMPGPIFFVQERIGKGKRTFKILKLRTMTVDRQLGGKLDFAKDSERITTAGKILRRTKIDELPQLINVFVGDMSLVGPRPTIMEQVEKYSDFQLQRLFMRPGMTGLAQINGNTSLPWEQRIAYDVDYIREFSVILDIEILVKTVAIVIFGEEKYTRNR